MQAVEHFAEAEGRRPRVLVVGLGTENIARAMAAGFAELGFDVDVAPQLPAPEAAARQAIENDVHVVVVCGDAAQVPALVEALKSQGAGDILVLYCGELPPAEQSALRQAGVAAIYGPDADIEQMGPEILGLVTTRASG